MAVGRLGQGLIGPTGPSGPSPDYTVVRNPETASYTLASSDANNLVEMNVSTSNNLTVPPNSSVAFPIGTQINVLQVGAGQTTLVAGSGVTINATPGLKISGQWRVATLIKRDTDIWVAFGSLTS